MMDLETIKSLAVRCGRKIDDFIAQTSATDPFYAERGKRRLYAEWFAANWEKYSGGIVGHTRRIHYKMLGQGIEMPDGDGPYVNTEYCATKLNNASRDARYLGLVPFDAIVDQRSDEAQIFEQNAELDPDEEREVSTTIGNEDPDVPEVSFPSLPELFITGLSDDAIRQDYVVEVWIEKSTQNDWLVPLCERRGVNLVIGTGHPSETRCRELAQRAASYAVPMRVLYISDFDPDGKSMPLEVARKAEFTIHKFGLDVDLQLIPLALSHDQCLEYKLQRTPLKESVLGKNKFEDAYGEGATELDAMEALHPGELGKIVEAEMDKFLDKNLADRVNSLRRTQELKLYAIEEAIHEQHREKIDDLESRFEDIESELNDLKTDAETLWSEIADELEPEQPDLSEVIMPRSTAAGETDSTILFDSRRSYLEQMDHYNAWKSKA